MRYPGVVRVVLSGQVELTTTERVLLMVHDYLSKPCEPEDLIATVERALDLGKSAHTDRLRRVAGSTTRLPSRPSVALEITSTMSDPDFSLDDIADAVTTDIGMAATILHLANSAFFARGTPAANVREAVRRLGAEVTAGAVLAAEGLHSFETTVVDVDRLSRHALRTVDAIRRITGLNGVLAIESAALHPIGQLVIATLLPNEYRAAIGLMSTHDMDLRGALQELLGFTDAHAGAYLMRLWKLDARVATAVEHMDDPWEATGDARAAAAALWAVHQTNGSRGSSPDTPDRLPSDLHELIRATGKEVER